MYYQKHQTRFVWPIVAVIVVIFLCDHLCNDQWRWLVLVVVKFPSSHFDSFLLSLTLHNAYPNLNSSADHDELRFGYALWSVKLNVTDIAQIEETNIRWIEWRGKGWRLKSLKHSRLHHR